MKKICAVTTIETTMEAFVIPAMRIFVEEGYEVSLICTMSDSFKEKYSGEFNLIPVSMVRGISFKEMLTKPIEFYKIFKKEKFDYVQYATTNAAWYASVAAWLARVPIRVNCLWGLLYSADSGLKRWVKKIIEKVPCIFSNRFLVASHKNLDLAVNDRLCRRDRALVIGDGGTVGVDLQQFDVRQREHLKQEMLNRYPSLDGKAVFGYLGRIDVDKGINELLEAFLKINKEDAALLLIGPLDDLRSGLRQDLLQRARSHRNIIFTGFTSEVPLHLSAVDMLVHPTYREGFSMVIQQAMAMGCAVITTDIPGPSEVIEVDKSGLLVPVKNLAALYGAMDRLYSDTSLREKFATSGLQRVREKFSRDRMVRLNFEKRWTID